MKRALSEALQLKVHLGLTPLAKKTLRREGGDNASNDKYMHQPLYLRAVSEQWTIPRPEIELTSTIGEGEEGVVYKGRWRMMPVVAKAIKPHLKGGDCEHEVSVLSHLRHPNLVLFLGAVMLVRVASISGTGIAIGGSGSGVSASLIVAFDLVAPNLVLFVGAVRAAITL